MGNTVFRYVLASRRIMKTYGSRPGVFEPVRSLPPPWRFRRVQHIDNPHFIAVPFLG